MKPASLLERNARRSKGAKSLPSPADVLKPVAFPANPSSGRRHLVDFQFYAPGAESVKVVIGLANSIPRHLELHDLGGGAWTLRLLLPAGSYEYYFLLDDQWHPDPLCQGLEGGEKTRLVLS